MKFCQTTFRLGRQFSLRNINNMQESGFFSPLIPSSHQAIFLKVPPPSHSLSLVPVIERGRESFSLFFFVLGRTNVLSFAGKLMHFVGCQKFHRMMAVLLLLLMVMMKFLLISFFSYVRTVSFCTYVVDIQWGGGGGELPVQEPVCVTLKSTRTEEQKGVSGLHTLLNVRRTCYILSSGATYYIKDVGSTA